MARDTLNPAQAIRVLSSGAALPAGARYIAYGAGGAFQNIARSGLLPMGCAYAVDNHFAGEEFLGIQVRRPAHLDRESRDDTRVVLFTMSSAVFGQLRRELVDRGFPPEHVLYYGDVFFEGLRARMAQFGLDLSRAHHDFTQTVSTLFGVDNHSSSLGTALLLALIRGTRHLGAPMVELGVYRGGNALAVCLVNQLEGERRAYHLMDSFEGFPQLSSKDPAGTEGMFRDTSFEDVASNFRQFSQVRICRGFIPGAFSQLPEQTYSVVYYDCDLHEPATATLEYFFPRLEPGGYLLFHDCLPKLGGFDGVRLAVDAFLEGRRDVERFEVPETTHVIIRKRGASD